jgi:hypothetical protein
MRVMKIIKGKQSNNWEYSIAAQELQIKIWLNFIQEYSFRVSFFIFEFWILNLFAEAVNSKGSSVN